jgi:hypothetical protein
MTAAEINNAAKWHAAHDSDATLKAEYSVALSYKGNSDQVWILLIAMQMKGIA